MLVGERAFNIIFYKKKNQ